MKKIFLILSLIILCFVATAQVNVAGFLQPINNASYPTHIDSLGYGGLQVVLDTNARNAITPQRRKSGMVVLLKDSLGIGYQLQNGITNSNWVKLSLNGSGFKIVQRNSTSLTFLFDKGDSTTVNFAGTGGGSGGGSGGIDTTSYRSIQLITNGVVLSKTAYHKDTINFSSTGGGNGGGGTVAGVTANLPLSITGTTANPIVNADTTSATGFQSKFRSDTARSSIYTSLAGKQPLIGYTPYNATNPSGYISNITPLLTQGTGITITGSGVSGTPYTVNANPIAAGTYLVPTDTVNKYIRPIAGPNMTITGTFPNLTFSATAAGGGVSTVYGRTGAVVAAAGDYNTSQVTESGNLYYTDTRARLSQSATAPLVYNSATGVESITQSSSSGNGYVSSSDWINWTGKENSLGNPSTSGFVLSSTSAGVRSWVAPATGGGGGTVTNVAANAPLSITGGGTVSPTIVADTATLAGLQTKFRTDSARTNIYTALSGKQPIGTYLIPADSVNRAIRPIAGTNTTITGTYPNLTFNSTASGGGVSTVSVVAANGFSGTVATATTTPAITLTTTVTGVLKGNGTAILPAIAGTDFGRVDSIRLVNSGVIHTSGTSFSLVGNTAVLTQTLVNQTANTFLGGSTTGGAAAPTFRAIVPADIPTLNQSTSGNALTATTVSTINGLVIQGTGTTVTGSGTTASPYIINSTGGATGTDKFGEENTGSAATTITLANTALTNTVRLFKNGVRLAAAQFSVTGATINLTAARVTTDLFQIDYKF